MSSIIVPHALLISPTDPNTLEREDYFFDADSSKVSDGYHTFEELYDHRVILAIGLFSKYPDNCWLANKHNDGTFFSDWLLLGMDIPNIGQVTYHIPEKYRELCREVGIPSIDLAPPFDNHSPKDVLVRLKKLLSH